MHSYNTHSALADCGRLRRAGHCPSPRPMCYYMSRHTQARGPAVGNMSPSGRRQLPAGPRAKHVCRRAGLYPRLLPSTVARKHTRMGRRLVRRPEPLCASAPALPRPGRLGHIPTPAPDGSGCLAGSDRSGRHGLDAATATPTARSVGSTASCKHAPTRHKHSRIGPNDARIK
ncbi:unnamed protein product [Protopolystoma xenopodis]|uniref:Uncharacterized protein n=1 Tax=Protopolystoma xenopodis TaxID=117903 RepID=A0A3S5CL30_9PLAT|nr:unnamed protein product [Protopolystoma xenopodis]